MSQEVLFDNKRQQQVLMEYKKEQGLPLLGVVGEIKTGKSCLINALLGQDIVPWHVYPCSSALNYIRWGDEKQAHIHYKNGQSERISIAELENYITDITESSREKSATVDYAVTCFPSPLLQHGVQIVDVPGGNCSEESEAVIHNVLPTLDAIIMVLQCDTPLSKSEMELLNRMIQSVELDRILFVINKWDALNEDEYDPILAFFKQRITNALLNMYPEDSSEYRSILNQTQRIQLFPVSARYALKGKLKNDSIKYEESVFPEFETSLKHLIDKMQAKENTVHKY